MKREREDERTRAAQGGWLAGKKEHTKENPATGSRIEWAEHAGWREGAFSNLNNPHTWQVLDAVSEVAWKMKKTSAQVSLRCEPSSPSWFA